MSGAVGRERSGLWEDVRDIHTGAQLSAGVLRPTILSVMSSTSSSIFQSIFDAALSDYATQTGIDLATYPFVQSLQNCPNPSAILKHLQERANQFRAYRDGNRKLINSLKPLVQVLNTLSGVLASAASMVSSARDPVLSDHTFTLTPPGPISTNKCHPRRR